MGMLLGVWLASISVIDSAREPGLPKFGRGGRGGRESTQPACFGGRIAAEELDSRQGRRSLTAEDEGERGGEGRVTAWTSGSGGRGRRRSSAVRHRLLRAARAGEGERDRKSVV